MFLFEKKLMQWIYQGGGIDSLIAMSPVPALTGHDEHWPLFHLILMSSHLTKIGITYTCNYSSSAGGSDLSSDTPIRVIGSMEPEISTKMLRNLIERLKAKLFSTTLGYSVVRIACLDDAFLEILELVQQAQLKVNRCGKKTRKEEKERQKKEEK